MDEALTIVVGYDGSDAARRALARVRVLGERASKVIVVAVATDLRSEGLGRRWPVAPSIRDAS